MRDARVLIALLLAALAFLASLGTASSATREEDFWAWFQTNEDRLYNAERNGALIITDLMDELEKVNENLSFEVGPPNADHQRDFVLSADGFLRAFPAVEALHAAAPELPRWNIIKFRQREAVHGGTVVASIDGEAQSGEMRYIMTTDGGKVAISLFLPGAGNLSHDVNTYVARLHLQVLLGEEDFGRFVRQVSVWDVTDERYNVSKPIVDLPSEFDAALKN
jgi:hypothetical protein